MAWGSLLPVRQLFHSQDLCPGAAGRLQIHRGLQGTLLLHAKATKKENFKFFHKACEKTKKSWKWAVAAAEVGARAVMAAKAGTRAILATEAEHDLSGPPSLEL